MEIIWTTIELAKTFNVPYLILDLTSNGGGDGCIYILLEIGIRWVDGIHIIDEDDCGCGFVVLVRIQIYEDQLPCFPFSIRELIRKG